jgi:Glycosyltransferase family 87
VTIGWRLPRLLRLASALPFVMALGAISLTIHGVARMLDYAQRYSVIAPDGLTYLAALHRFEAGEPLYTALQRGQYVLTDASWGAGFVYPPTALPILAPIAWVGTDLWRVANWVVLLAATLAIVRHERGGLSVLSVLVAATYLAYNPFVWSAWTNAQVTPLLIGVMVLGYLYPRLAGVAGTVGALVKVYPGVMWLWALRFGGWRALATGVVTLIGLLAITWPVFGSAWPGFFLAVSNGVPSCDVGLPDSIRCVVGEGFGQMAAFVSGGLVVGLGLGLRSRQLGFACLCFGTMLSAPDLNSAYWLLPVIGIVPAVATMTPGLPRQLTGSLLTRPFATRRPSESHRGANPDPLGVPS